MANEVAAIRYALQDARRAYHDSELWCEMNDAGQTYDQSIDAALDAADKRIEELEAMAAEMVYAIPGGAVCDPQSISDVLREIAAKHGVQIR